MIERGAKIRWECEVSPLAHCGATDLNAIARAKGGDFTLANRRPACRIPGCPGRIRFMDKSYVWPRQVDTIDERYAAWWDYSAAEKERLYALGWWLEMGKWQPPPAPVYGRGPDSKTPPARTEGVNAERVATSHRINQQAARPRIRPQAGPERKKGPAA